MTGASVRVLALMMLAFLSVAGLWFGVQPSRIQAHDHTFREFLAGQVGKTVNGGDWTAKIIEVKSDYVVLQPLTGQVVNRNEGPGARVVFPISQIEWVAISKDGRIFW